ncbi:MAG: hypothetical protein HY823_03820 [Acidobacteria bacterium]|nr:hypothetical protein [Acidobacteriota bacterium]
MIPLELRPGFRAWGGRLEALRAHPGPLWIWGEAGCGVSGFLAWLGAERGAAILDDADGRTPSERTSFLQAHPRGILGGHRDPEAAGLQALAFRLPSLEEDPQCIPGLLAGLAREEGLEGGLPGALGRLPCPGNLRGLANRIQRWKVLGQLPAPPEEAALPLEAEDLATNLHVLERALLYRALRRSYGNRVEAARRLGVSRPQLYLLVARHGDPVRGDLPSAPPPLRLKRRGGRPEDAPPAGNLETSSQG